MIKSTSVFTRIILLFIALFTFGITSYSQEILFQPNTSDVSSISFGKNLQGTFKDDTKYNHYIVTENRIISRSYFVQTISKRTVRESSAYNVKGNFLHGFYKNGDSLKVILEDSTYFFVYKEMLDEVGGTNALFTKISPTEFAIYKKAGTVYEMRLLTLKGGKIIERELDITKRSKILSIIKEKKEIGGNTVINPTKSEWKELIKKGFFEINKEFTKK